MPSEDTIQKIFNTLDGIKTDTGETKIKVARIEAQLEHKVDEVKMIREVEKQTAAAITTHVTNCRASEVTGRIDVPSRGAPVVVADDKPDKNSGTIRISISGLHPVVRWILYIGIPTAMAFGGHQVGSGGIGQ